LINDFLRTRPRVEDSLADKVPLNSSPKAHGNQEKQYGWRAVWLSVWITRGSILQDPAAADVRGDLKMDFAAHLRDVCL